MKFIYPILTVTLLCHSLSFASEVKLTTSELINAIQSGGHILYMRHGPTEHEQKDSDTKDLSNCATQRNLSVTGRTMTAKIGEQLKALNIPIGQVLSSPYCRAKETAQLTFAKFTVEAKLQFSISKNKPQSQALGQQLRHMMLSAKTQNHNAVFVGHTSNLRDGLGIWPKPEGVIVIFQRINDEITYKGMIKPNDWTITK